MDETRIYQRQGSEISRSIINSHYCPRGRHVLSKGFHIALVTSGTARITDTYGLVIGVRDLIMLTPGMRAVFDDMDTGFEMTCIHIEPDYFDSLRDGQTMYTQLSKFMREYGYPILHLTPDTFEYINRTMALFSDRMDGYRHRRNAIYDRLCGFLLLQVADLLFENRGTLTPLCVLRSDEIFRRFKKLLTENYRRHHKIGFYADVLHMSATYLSRTVKRTTGHTVRFHIAELLGADARRLLESTDMEVKQIADTLGFSDQSVFGKFFTKMTGFSPVKYRMRRQ